MYKRLLYKPLTFFSLAFTILFAYSSIDVIPYKAGMFCWEKEALNEYNSEELIQFMKDNNLDTLYQYIPKDTNIETISNFLSLANENRIKVYWLDGDPSWAKEEYSSNVIKLIEHIIEIVKQLPEEATLSGIMLDIEPYLLPEWKQKSNRPNIMENMVSSITAGFIKASKYSLDYQVCIPYYYDSLGLDKQLERLISQGCSGIAIMNYNKSNEIKQINTECEIAKKYRRQVTVIYEMQPPEKYGLKENNTYYNDGLDAVKKSWKDIYFSFSYKKLKYAFHEYKSLKEVISNE